MYKAVLTLLISFSMFSQLGAKEVAIEMLNKRDDGQLMVYSKDVVKVDSGDTINWLATSKGHNVEMIAGPEGASLPGRSNLSKDFTMTFDAPGIYLYVCTPHKAMGMLAIVIVGGDISNKESIAKMKMVGKGKKKLKAIIAGL